MRLNLRASIAVSCAARHQLTIRLAVLVTRRRRCCVGMNSGSKEIDFLWFNRLK
jgi:hypothetical protein